MLSCIQFCRSIYGPSCHAEGLEQTGRTRPGDRTTQRDKRNAEFADGTLCHLAQDGCAWCLDAAD